MHRIVGGQADMRVRDPRKVAAIIVYGTWSVVRVRCYVVRARRPGVGYSNISRSSVPLGIMPRGLLTFTGMSRLCLQFAQRSFAHPRTELGYVERKLRITLPTSVFSQNEHTTL